MNQQEILHNAQKEFQEKVLVQTEKKQIVKRGRKAKPIPVMTVEKPQPQALVKKVAPQNLEYLEGELSKVFTVGSYDIDTDSAVVNFRGGKKIHECESLSQPAQTLIQCAKSYVSLSFGNQG